MPWSARRPRASRPTRLELATAFHAFYRDARVIDPDEPERSASRLALARAAQVTLARTLGLLGISAPEAM